MCLKFACPILYIMNCIEIENFRASTFCSVIKTFKNNFRGIHLSMSNKKNLCMLLSVDCCTLRK